MIAPATRAEATASLIIWKPDVIAGVRLRRFTGEIGSLTVGTIEFDGSNRLWTWFSPLVEDAWGFAPTEQAAKQAFEIWLRNWLENFRPFFERT